MKGVARDILEKAAALAALAEVACECAYVEDGYPSEAILRAATKCGCDLIVMGSHGRQGLERLLIGSETQRVLAKSTIPVLVVPSGQGSAERYDPVHEVSGTKEIAGSRSASVGI